MATARRPRIFLSYRRADTQHQVARLTERLNDEFNESLVFFDRKSVELGEDIVERIEREASSCDVLLAIIGPQWATLTDKQGRRRLDNPDDPVALEVRTALNCGIRVIPVLIDDAGRPTPEQLPPGLEKLSRLLAAEIKGEFFSVHATALIAKLKELLPSHTTAAPPRPPQNFSPPETFVGRETELAVIGAVVEKIDREGGAGVVVLKGRAGVGKSALAATAAYQKIGVFQNGIHPTDLCGYAAAGKDSDIVATLLRDVAGFGRTLPPSADGRKMLWQSWTATQQLQLILENVSQSEQIQDLIPRCGKHLTLITTRDDISIDPAGLTHFEELELEPLDEDAALLMFQKVARPDHHWNAREVQDAKKLIKRWGYLPFTINIMATGLRHQGADVTQLLAGFEHDDKGDKGFEGFEVVDEQSRA